MACQEQLLSGGNVHTHAHTQSHGEARQGSQRAKELMAFSGISKREKRSGSGTGRSPAQFSPV